MTTPNTSQTPETDAQEFRAFNRSSVTGNPTSTLFVVSSDFAKSLEERLIATEKRCKELKTFLHNREETLKRAGEDWVRLHEQIDQLKVQNEELRKDKERLDWLGIECLHDREGISEIYYQFLGSFRESIDDAILRSEPAPDKKGMKLTQPPSDGERKL
jgi:hypothetical protein